MANHFNDRTGETNINFQGCEMKVIKYRAHNDVDVLFTKNGYITKHRRMTEFYNGSIKNLYHESVYGIGFQGERYPTSINGRKVLEYQIWNGMLQRCYERKKLENNPTYAGVSVCDKWLNYENFYGWINGESNFLKYKKKEIILCLDKDIIIKGNKVYGEDQCCLVPRGVNSLFTKANTLRGDLPIGVRKNGSNYMAACSDPRLSNQREKYIGTYKDPIDAFYAYKEYKEALIKDIAQSEFNAGNITERCYRAMLNYQVEITD